MTNFRERMTGTESTGDLAIRIPLKKLVSKAQFQQVIILEATNADALIDNRAENKPSVAGFLDGPVHLTSNAVKLRDEYVTNALESKGYIVVRYPYRPPLTPKQAEEFAQKMAKANEL